MKLFTKDIDRKLFRQFPKGSDLGSQNVVAKIFNPYGAGRWYLLNSDPDDPNYLWAIVEMNGTIEIGSVSRRELETTRVRPWNLPLERDLGYSERNAKEVYEGLMRGKFFEKGGEVENKKMLENKVAEMQHHTEELHAVIGNTKDVEPWVITKAQRAATDLADITHYLEGEQKFAAGGMVAGRFYLDKEGNELRYVGDKGDGKGLFMSGRDYVTKPYDDFSPTKKESKLFGFFQNGGETPKLNLDALKAYIYPRVQEICKPHGIVVRQDLALSDGGTKLYLPDPFILHEEGNIKEVVFMYKDDEYRSIGKIEYEADDDELEVDFPMWNIHEEK